jgi:hypothetical protein
MSDGAVTLEGWMDTLSRSRHGPARVHHGPAHRPARPVVMTGSFGRHGPARPGHLNQHSAARGGPDEPGHDEYEPGHDEYELVQDKYDASSRRSLLA